MNLMFTKVTLNNFFFVMNMFYTVPTMKFGIIGKHIVNATFCSLHTQPVIEMKSPVE